jgi:hypothetical protein
LKNEPKDARSTIIKWRTDRQIATDVLAKHLSISARLLDEIEAGGFTHPKIALRIQKTVGLTDSETQQLVSPNHVDDVIRHQINLRNDSFQSGGKRRFTDQEIEYNNYIFNRCLKSKKK